MVEKRILLVDDDVELCRLLERSARWAGLTLEAVHSGREACQRVKRGEYVLIILDVMLPEMDGFAVLQAIRSQSRVPVLMLTARDADEDKVKGLLSGADDYLTKPFGWEELLARMQSLIRRYTVFDAAASEDVVSLKGLSINRATREVAVGDQAVALSSREFDVLWFLAAHAGQVFTKRQLYEQLWPEEGAFDEGNMMAFISKLRKKIEPAGEPYYIQTVKGVGYRFNREAAKC